jgi:hypothetical protein
MKTPTKEMSVPINQINRKPENNVRRTSAYSAIQLASLRNDLALRGQETPVWLHKNGSAEYRTIRGYRRLTAIDQEIAAGNNNPITGKPWTEVRAIVYEGLSEEEIILLMLDHSQTRGLDRIELQNSAERLFGLNKYSEKEISIILYDLLVQHFPPTRKIKPAEEDKGQDIANYFRGVVQSLKRLYDAPTVLHDAYLAKLDGKQKWPRKSEMESLSDIHVKECKADTTGIKYSKAKPGPLFMEKWNALQKAVRDGTATGNKPKPVSMANRQQVEDTIKGANSLLVKAVCSILLRNVSPDKMQVVDKLAVETEKLDPKFEEKIKALLA